MENKSFKDLTLMQLICNLPKRFIELINKLISMKGVILVGSYLMVAFEHIPKESASYFLGFVTLIVLFGIEGLKWIKDMKK